MKSILITLMFFMSAVSLQAQNTSFLFGSYFAPVGAKIELQNNGGPGFFVVAEPSTSNDFSRTLFKIPTALAHGAAYNVTIKSAPAGLGCLIKNNAGTMGTPAGSMTIECDCKYDHVSRSTRDSSFSTFYESTSPVVGGNGNSEARFVAFVSNSAGFNGSTGKHRQIFVRDRNTGNTRLVSHGVNGEEGNGDSFAPAITTDGHSIVFESHSGNLVENDKNAVRDVFMWNYYTEKIERISVGPGGVEGNADSFEPVVNCTDVAFTSYASNLTEGVEGTSMANVYLHNIRSGENKLVSMDPVTHKGVGGSKPAINMDCGSGTQVAFCSGAATLVPGDVNGLWDIFVYHQYKPMRRVSMTFNGGERNQGTESASRIVAPSISGNGKFVAFATTASNMVPDDHNNAQDVFVVDMESGSVQRASVDAAGKESNGDSPIGQGEKIAIDYKGQWIAFSSKANNLGAPESNIIMHNIRTGQTRALSNITGSYVSEPSISQDGNYLVFGAGIKLDPRFASSGIFAAFTGVNGSRFFFHYSY